MKILHVAVFTSKSTNVWQADAFEDLGHEVIRYDYRAKARELDGSLTSNNPKRDNDIINLCRKEKPDIILFSKCNWLDVHVVKECGKIGTTVLWYMDGIYSMDKELVDKMKHSNYVFCAIKDCAFEAKKHCQNSYRHPCGGGFDSRIHYPIDVPKIRDVVFIGNVHSYVLPYRAQFKKEVNFDIINGVYNKKHSRVVSETRINLCFTAGGGVSNRLYKLLAARGFVLTMPWDTMLEDFEPGKDFDVFSTPAELNDKIKYYLKNEDEREVIASYGYRTVQKYSYINYAKFMLEELENGEPKS